MQLRGYQSKGIDDARAARRKGHRRILLQSPTGAGKTVLATAMIQSAVETHAQRVLVVAHRKELIDQFWGHLTRAGLRVRIMRGSDERTDAEAPVQVWTVQTLTRRTLTQAHMVVVDEAHRAPGEGYRRILEAYPLATIFGLTATPCRLDGKPLNDVFDVLVPVSSYSELIDEGAIMAPIVYRAKVTPNVSKVRKVAGDFNEHDLEAAVMSAHVIGDVVRSWIQHARRGENECGEPQYLKTVLFAVGIDHSKELVQKFRKEGIRAAHLDGTTSEDAREQILLDLELGKLDLVSNVGVLCEGWDQPSVRCCIMARPTLSLTLWMQCAGRVLRPWEDPATGQRVAPLILDHSGNVDRHGLPHEDRTWSLEGTAKLARPSQYRMCPGCYAYVEASPCPLCGYAAEPRERKIRQADGVLERIDAGIARDRMKPESSDPKRAAFDKFAEQARSKGFKPGYAAAKFKEKFDDAWPPWAWSQQLKREYEADTYWQERVAKRTREREYWADRNKAAEMLAQDAAEFEAPAEEPGIGDW